MLKWLTGALLNSPVAFVAFPLFPPPFLSSFTGLGTENLTCFLRNSSNLLKPDFFFSKTSVNYSPRWILGFLRFFFSIFSCQRVNEGASGPKVWDKVLSLSQLESSHIFMQKLFFEGGIDSWWAEEVLLLYVSTESSTRSWSVQPAPDNFM